MNFVSVIIPNYNHAQYLQRRIESILNQTYQNFEIIILDDCSTDSSRDIIEQYRNHPKVSHIEYNQQNGGTSYKQWYKGIAYAKGDIVWIAESDDLSSSFFLESLVFCFKNENVVLAYSSSSFFNNNKDIKLLEKSGRIVEYDGIDFIRNKMLFKNYLYNANMVIFRKEHYEKVKDKGFSKMKLCGDWLLWTQIMSFGKVNHNEAILSFFRKHDLNTTNKFRKQGLDFIEGVRVLNFGIKVSDYKYDRIKIFKLWRDRYLTYKPEFYNGIKLKIYLIFLFYQTPLFVYLIFKSLKVKVKFFFK